MKLEKGIPLIDQHDENGYWGGKFGGNQIAESLNYPIEELTREFEKLRNDETLSLREIIILKILLERQLHL